MNPLRWRKMTWVLAIWNVLFLILLVALVAAPGKECDTPEQREGLSRQTCENVSDVGAGLGVLLLLVIWFPGFLVLSLVWLMSRPRHRQCPRCGEDVKKGKTTCKKCGYDFAAAGEQSGPPTDPAPSEPRRETGP